MLRGDEDTPVLTPSSGDPPSGAGAAPELQPGERLGGRFLVRQRLGSGGAGTVYAALDERVGQRVAVKVLRPELADNVNLERLRREVRAARSGHPNIVGVFDLHSDNGCHFLSMELVQGRSLADLLRGGECLPVNELVAVGAQVAAALAHLHAAGLIHRDVKPGNILVTGNGVAKLCDLGLARPTAGGVTVTEAAMVVGTPAYMAPEQSFAAGLTAASDVYALGVTLYRCLAGSVPLEGTTAVETLMLRQHAPPPRLPPGCRDAPRWLARLLRRMLEPDPRDRPTAAAVSAALATHRITWRPARRQLRLAALAVAAALVMALVGLGIRELVASPPLDASSPLFASTEAFDNGTRLVIFDAGGNVLWDEVLDHRWPLPKLEFADRRPLAFGDLDGDGLQDAVIAQRSTNVERPVEILLRRPDGSLKRSTTLPSTEGFDYEGEHFGTFRPNDVSCADLDGDGAAEIVLVEHSAGLYPATLRVLKADGRELFRLWHPGVLRGCASGDRDGDGRPELYLGGTCNFLTPPASNTSRPVMLVVEADWTRPDQQLDLFGPDRRLRPPDAPGIRILYAAWPRIDRPPYRKPWQEAIVYRVIQGDGTSFLMVNASQARPPILGLESDHDITLRHVFLDRELRVSGAQWNPVVMASLAIDPEDPALQALLRPDYWTGDGWSSEPVFVGASH